jgi:hypothetical protein
VIGRHTFALADPDDEEHWRVWREGITMVLYLSVVLLATFAAVPAAHEGVDGWIRELSSGEMIEVLWGTTLGLAIAHWFAFDVATHGVGGGHLRGQDLREALAQLGGAALVATLATVPVLVFGPTVEQRVLPYVLALIIGVTDYLVERVNGRTRVRSAVFGAVALLIAVIVATIKVVVSAH